MAKNNGKYAIQLMDLLPVIIGFELLSKWDVFGTNNIRNWRNANQ